MRRPFPPYGEKKRREVQQVVERRKYGHGRYVEYRLEVSPRLAGWDGWPGLQQVCRLTRTTRRDGQKTVEVQYAITSLSPSEAGAAELLELWCHHWDIENRLHWVRDTAWGEDRCRIRTPHLARLFAAFRNAAINLLRLEGVENITAALRENAYRVDVLLSRLRGVKK